MKTSSRITSILKANCLDTHVTGLPTFELSQLHLTHTPIFELPTQLRLGHLAERVVSECIQASTNYTLLYENIQLLEDKKTIGEIDFILQEVETQQITHVELAYKFYLYDPSRSSEVKNNWIGPNKNDSLTEKLEKLKTKQFSLLYHPCAKRALDKIDVHNVTQALCLLVSLYIPYTYKGNFNPSYSAAIKGYYLDLKTFIHLDNATKTYRMPPKKEWGMEPSENKTWVDYTVLSYQLTTCIAERQAPLIWQKDEDSFTQFFVVWW